MKNFRLVISISIIWGLVIFSGCEFIFPRIELLEPIDEEVIKPNDESDHTNLIITPKTEGTPQPANEVCQFSSVSLLAGLPGGPGNLDGIGNRASFNMPEGITSDSNFIYVADTYNHTIRRIKKSTQEVITIAGKTGITGDTDGFGTNALFYYPTSLTIDESFLYITTRNRIKKIHKQTLNVETIQNSHLISGGRITNDELYIYYSDTYNHTIKRINKATSTVEIMAGSPGERGNKDGNGKNALFYLPEGITNDGSYLYVCDYYNDAIRRIDKNTFAVDTIIKEIKQPTGITLDESFLYVIDDSNTTKKIDKDSLNIISVIGSGRIGNIDGIGTAAQFSNPEGISSDGIFLYLSDTANHTIRQINKNTLNVTTIAGLNENEGDTDGIGSTARFYFPKGITRDENFIYITDYFNFTIKKIDKETLAVNTIAKDNTATSFNFPAGITTDQSFLYITEKNNHVIKQINKETWETTTIAGENYNTKENSITDGLCLDGIGSKARFFYPEGITNDETFIYIADTGNHTIRKINKNTKEVVTIAGSAGNPGGIDRYGTDAKFNSPTGITTDESFLYVSDKNNNRIRRINKITLEVTTIAGSGDSGSTDGIGINAHFKLPEGIANNESFIYVADTGNHTIRRIEKGTWRVDTIAGLAGKFGNREGVPHDSRFSSPSGIIIDDSVLYITDSDNNAIIKIE